MSNFEIALQMRGICKAFSGAKAPDNVDFEVRKGEVHVLLGENSAEKSTLMKILSRVYVKDGGEIFLADKPVEIHGVRETQALVSASYIGEVCLNGEKMTRHSLKHSINSGLEFFPEDRKIEDLVLEYFIKNNIVQASLTKLLKSFIVNRKFKIKKRKNIAKKYVLFPRM